MEEKVVEGSKTVYYIFCLNSNPNSWWSTPLFSFLQPQDPVLLCKALCHWFANRQATWRKQGRSFAWCHINGSSARTRNLTLPVWDVLTQAVVFSSREVFELPAGPWVRRQLASHGSCSAFVFSAASLITLMQVAQKIRFFILLFLTIPFSSVQLCTDCQGFCCYLMEGEAQPVLTGRVSPSAFSFIPPHTRST